MESSTWRSPEKQKYSLIESLYVNEYLNEAAGSALITSEIQAVSVGGGTTVMPDKFRGLADEDDYYEFQSLGTEDYIDSLEDD